MITETQISSVIASIILREGGYVDDPLDRGGATNYGITQATADQFAAGDVAQLTPTRAASIYRRLFADWRIDQMVEYHTFALVADCCVNHGGGRGVAWLQVALGVTADGVIGPQTLGALTHAHIVPRGDEALYAAIVSQRIKFYGALISGDHTQARFAGGWMNRVAGLLRPWPWA